MRLHGIRAGAAALGAVMLAIGYSLPAVAQGRPARIINPDCRMPAASSKAKVVVLSAYETSALSSVSLGSQDAVVHAGDIVIEPGKEPLYIVVPSFRAVIWRFSGALERIERVVLTSKATGANRGTTHEPFQVGATGLPKSKIAFMPKSTCIPYFHEMGSKEATRAVTAVRDLLGRQPQVVAAAYEVAGFRVPSGKVEKVKKRGFQSPPDVVKIDKADVVGSVPAIDYRVPPQQAGIEQLLASGALERKSLDVYVVRKAMTFPAGLHGANSATFIVPRGVPVPGGDPGHSCVLSEDPRAVGFGACIR